MSKKLFSVVFLFVFFVGFLSVLPVFAVEQIEDWAGEVDDYLDIKILYPSSDGVLRGAYSYTFNATVGGWLTNITVALRKSGNPVGEVGVRLMALDIENEANLFDNHPNSTILAQCENFVDMESLASASWTNCNFTFDGTYELLQGGVYCFMVYASSATTLNSVNYVRVAYEVGDAVHSGYYFSQYNSTFPAGSSSDFWFFVYSDDEGFVTPSPSPSSTASPYVPSEIEVLFEDLMTYVAYLLVLLVPALLLWWKAGKWGFFTGLICGAVLSYLFLLLVFCVVFMLGWLLLNC